MFPLPYRPPVSAILYALFFLELALLGGGLAFGKLNREGTGHLPRPLRMGLSTILVIAAFLGWQSGARGTPVQVYAALIFLGMAAAFVGDLIMAELIPVPSRLIFGMIAFGIGHLFYIAAFLCLRLQFGFAGTWSQFTIVAAMLVFCLWAWRTYVRKPGGSKAINIGSLVYGLLVGIMTALAISLALQQTRLISLGAGAVLFLASDFILGNWQVRGHVWKPVNDAIWTAYASGQLLIVYSVAAALNLLS
jgi:hypothetical protein